MKKKWILTLGLLSFIAVSSCRKTEMKQDNAVISQKEVSLDTLKSYFASLNGIAATDVSYNQRTLILYYKEVGLPLKTVEELYLRSIVEKNNGVSYKFKAQGTSSSINQQ